MQPSAKHYIRVIAAPLVEAMTSLAIAVVLAALLFLPNSTRYLGSDLTQKLYLKLDRAGGALGDPVARGLRSEMPPPIKKWVLIDLGGPFCNSGSEPARCPPDRARTDRQALAKVVASVRASGPRVVVLDVATPPRDAGEDDVLRASLASSGSPVILVWFPAGGAEEAEKLTLKARREDFLCTMPECPEMPSVRYLPALVERSSAVARRLNGTSHIAYEGREWQTLSAALGAAFVATAPLEKPWSQLDAFAARRGSDVSDICQSADPLSCVDLYNLTDRVFSFPPVTPGGSAFSGSSSYRQISPNFPPGELTDLKDAVVVIGDTRRTAGDRWWTAAGDVSGAEIILNDIRQFMLAPPVPTHSLPSYLTAKLPFLLSGFFVVFLVNIFFDWHSFPLKRKRTMTHSFSTTLRNGVREVSRLLLVFVLTAGLFLLIIFYGPSKLGAPPDVVTPFVVIMAESTFGILHKFANACHSLGQTMLSHLLGDTSKGGHK